MMVNFSSVLKKIQKLNENREINSAVNHVAIFFLTNESFVSIALNVFGDITSPKRNLVVSVFSIFITFVRPHKQCKNASYAVKIITIRVSPNSS